MKRRKQSKHSNSRPSRTKSKSKSAVVRKEQTSFLIPEGELNLFHCMCDRIGDEVIVIDKQARIVFVNQAAIKGIGHTKKVILSRRFTDFLEDKISVKQWQSIYFKKVKKTKRPVSYTLNRISRGGKVRTIDMTVVYMPYQSNEYVLAVGRDITEQLAFQQKLKESEDRYRLLGEQAADGILMIDPKGETIYANRSAGEMFKTTALDLIGSHFETHVDKSSTKKIWQYFRKVKSGDPIIHHELEIKDKKGKLLPVEFSASPVYRNGKVVQILVIFRDISQKREMESLKRESEKIESIQHFIAGTTHEIQQPLKGLLDHSQSLIDRYKNRDFEYIGYKEFKDIIKTLQTMNDQVKYCFDTTDRLNSLNRKKAKLEDRCCNVNHIIRTTLKLLKHSLEVSEISLKLNFDPKLPHAAMSTLDLSQAINNIVTNAIQSLPGNGGTIKIKTLMHKGTNTIRVVCTDDGVGIPEEVLTRVFDPFFTTKPRGLEKNSGLGLFIVYSIIKSYQGEINVKSRYRKGTAVTIDLPVFQLKRKRHTK